MQAAERSVPSEFFYFLYIFLFFPASRLKLRFFVFGPYVIIFLSVRATFRFYGHNKKRSYADLLESHMTRIRHSKGERRAGIEVTHQ